MVVLRIDYHQAMAVADAPHDPFAAGKCLALFAERLRKENHPADPLVTHFVRALEAASSAPASKRAKVLTDALYLTAPRKRVAANWMSVAMQINGLTAFDGLSKTAAIAKAADDHAIDIRTARNYLAKYEEAVKDANRRV